jgi:hypothetical protein
VRGGVLSRDALALALTLTVGAWRRAEPRRVPAQDHYLLLTTYYLLLTTYYLLLTTYYLLLTTYYLLLTRCVAAC